MIEALRDEPDQDHVLGKRLASEAALSSVLEKALLLQRTLLTGKKEPNVAANELAVKAVDQENTALEQEINNLKTELELRRTLAGNSAMAIIQRHGTALPVRAASSRATRRATVCGKSRNAAERAMSRGLAAAGMAVQPPRRHRAAVGAAGGGHRGRCGTSSASTSSAASTAGAMAAEHAGHFRVAAASYGATVYGWWWMRRRLREREPSRDASAPAARRDRGRRHPVVAKAASYCGQWLSPENAMTLNTTDLPGVLPDPGRGIVNNGI